MPSEPERPERTGFFTCLGFCWVCVQPVAKRRIFRRLKLCLGPSWSSQVSFFPHPSRRRRISSKIFKECWRAALHARLLTTQHHRRFPFQKIFCCQGLSWSAAKPSSRPCHRSTTAHFRCWRGHFIFSRFRSVPGQRPSLLTASSPAIPQRMRRPPSRPAEVDRRPPSSQQ